jgi:predicted permease
MSLPRRLFRLGIRRPGGARDEMLEELEFHLESRIAQLVARGLSPEAARREAVRRLGGSLAQTRRRLGDSAERRDRRMDMLQAMRNLADDVAYAVRGLARRPGITIAAVLMLAIGIGANTALYSAVDALLLRSLPYAEPSRLMDVVQTNGPGGNSPWSWPRYRYFRDAATSYASIALHQYSQTTLTGTDPERIGIEEVTAAYLPTLGLKVRLGHDFPGDLDAGPGARKVALISDALWQRRYNADPAVTGRTISLNRESWEIAGVLPPGFRGLSGRADVLVNLTARQADDLIQPWSLEFDLIGRLRPGVTPAAAASEAHILGGRIAEVFPVEKGTLTTDAAPERWSADARPLNAIRVAPALRRSLLVLFGAVGMVLLITCVNMANLLMARALARKQEIAVRLAIGASRARLIRLLVTESVVLALMGGVASLGVALAGARILSLINPTEALRAQGLAGGIGAVSFEMIHLDASALAFAFGLTLVVGLLFGLAPAWSGTRADLSRDLRDGSPLARGGRGIGVSRRSLVVAEVALALVLLAGSGLMLRSLGNLLQVDPGFDARHVLTLRLALPPGEVAHDSMPGFYDEIQAALAALPGVDGVALEDCPPLNGGCNSTIMTFADRPPSATGNAMIGVHWVSPEWFRTMRVPLLRGRGFTGADRIGAPKVVVINETAARRYFPGEDPLGKQVAVYQGGFNTGAEVVGIVGDVRYETIDSTARPDAYIPYAQAPVGRMMIFARTTQDPAALAPSAMARLRQVAPSAPIYDIQPMESRLASASSQARFSAILLGLFALVALTLAVTGIYGVMSFAVAQRTREIGIRIALGADRRRVLALILREGGLLALVGAGIGLAAALASTRVLRGMLFEVTTTDPGTYAAMIVVLAAAALTASWLPARRAARVDPMVAIRAD